MLRTHAGWALVLAIVVVPHRLTAQTFELKATVRCDAETSFKALDVSRDGRRIVVGSTWGVEAWDVERGKLVAKWKQFGSDAVAIASDGKLVTFATSRLPEGVSGAAAKEAKLIYSLYVIDIDVDVNRAARLTLETDAKLEDVASLAFSADGNTLVQGTDKGTIAVWDVARGKVVANLRQVNDGRSFGLNVAISADGKTLASAGKGTDLMVWKLPSDQGSPLGKSKPVAVSMSADGELIVARSARGVIETWKGSSPHGKPRTIVGPSADASYSCAVSPNGRLVAATSGDFRPRFLVWDSGGKQIDSPANPEKVWSARLVKFSGDGKRLVVGFDPGPGTNDPKPAVAVYEISGGN